MVQIDGKYQWTRSDNFLEFLKAQGAQNPDLIDKANTLLTISKEGDKVTISDVSAPASLTKTYTIGEINEEELAKDVKSKTNVTLEGNKLSFNSDDANNNLKRIYEFSDDGLTITYFSSRNIRGRRYFNRV